MCLSVWAVELLWPAGPAHAQTVRAQVVARQPLSWLTGEWCQPVPADCEV
jgi:hypothetical protein